VFFLKEEEKKKRNKTAVTSLPISSTAELFRRFHKKSFLLINKINRRLI